MDPAEIEYTVWDADERACLAVGVRWPYVTQITGADESVRARVDASELALQWAGYVIQRDSDGGK
jgi:hypothetical protein